MFNLEKAIMDWRRRMAAGGVGSPELLDEFEAHLREDVEQQMRAGTGEARAFELAAQRIGQPNVLAKEFAKAGHLKWRFLRTLKRVLLRGDNVPFPSLENFAPPACHTLELAPQEARRFHHDFVGTEHVLLGLTQSPSEIISRVMRRLGVTSEAVREEIEKVVSSGPQNAMTPGNIPFTPRARKALQLASDEARALRSPRINAEHILLGLIREGSGVAALVLKNLGVRIERAREVTEAEMRANPAVP